MSKEVWRGSHPLLATVDVRWGKTIPYCPYCSKEPTPATSTFIEAAQQLLTDQV